MTITSTTNRVSVGGDGETTTFSFPHRFLQPSDLVVILRTNATKVDVVQTLGTHYNVTGEGDASGGSVIFDIIEDGEPTAGETVIIYNDPGITQGTDFRAGDPLPAETLETTVDLLTLQQQRTRNMVERTPRLADGDPDGSSGYSASGFKITNLKLDPTAIADVTSKNYVDSEITTRILAGAGAITTSDSYVTGTGTVTSRKVGDRWAEVRNVKDFGATGDPSGDDTEEVQAAIDDLQTDGGGILYFPRGTYIISNVTLGTSKFLFRGEGRGVTILKHKTGSSEAMLVKTGAAVGVLEFSDMTIDGNRAGITSWTIGPIDVFVNYFFMRGCEITGSRKSGVRLRTISSYARITECTFTDGEPHGGSGGFDTNYIQVGKTAASDSVLEVDHCRFEGPGHAEAGRSVSGVIVSPDDDATYQQRCLIHHNYFSKCGYDHSGNISSPIHGYRYCDNSEIHHNTIEDSVGIPIVWQKSSDVFIHHNVCNGESNFRDPAASAITLSGRTTAEANNRMTVHDNHIVNMPSAAYGIAAFFDEGGVFSDLTISDNRIDGTKGGIYANWVKDSLRITGNDIRSTTSTTGTIKTVLVDNLTTDMRVIFSGNYLEACKERVLINAQGSAVDDTFIIVRDNHWEQCGTSGQSNLDVRHVDTLVLSGNTFNGLPVDVSETNFNTIINQYGDYSSAIRELADEDTPSVANDRFFVTSGTANDPITDFDDGVVGQEITILSEHSVVITDGTHIILHGSSDFTMAASDSLTLVLKADNKWYEVSRMVNASGTYTATNVSTDRAYDANSTTTAELADVLGTLIADLRAQGIVT